jgi:mono/diheme cytochrome c family protein
MKKLLLFVIVLGVAAALAGWFLSAPTRLDENTIANLGPGDPGNGELVFWASGCSSCHAAPEAKGDDKLKLGGGLRLETPFGVFVAPNVSQDPNDGIGNWSIADLANAMTHGTSPDGRNYYPAFPYASYARMDLADINDLFSFMKTLPAVGGDAGPNELAFPFNIRRGVGLWKRMFLDPAPVVAAAVSGEDVDPAIWERGRYLVEGPGHCGECHTPRDLAGGLILSDWLGGAPAATGEGRVPNITPVSGGFGSWSASDVAYYLESGFTPDYDSVGGEMVPVQENMARLPASDREAIGVYLKAIPAVSGAAQ